MVVARNYIPERGDVVWMDFEPQAGHEQSGRRPAVVLTPASYNERVGLMLACPVTTQQKNYPFELEVPKKLPVMGVVLTDQVKSFDWRSRRTEYFCRVDRSFVQEIQQRIDVLLGGD